MVRAKTFKSSDELKEMSKKEKRELMNYKAEVIKANRSSNSSSFINRQGFEGVFTFDEIIPENEAEF